MCMISYTHTNLWIQSIRVDHKVPIGQIHFGGLALVLCVEKLGQCSTFNPVNGVIVEPGGVGRDDDAMRLLRHVSNVGVLLLPRIVHKTNTT